MAFLKLNFCMVVISVMCTINSVKSEKLQMLESGFNLLRESLSDLELKVFTDELEIRNELEHIWSVLNTSNSGERFMNELTVNLDIVVDTIKKLEERSRIITKGFTGEKENLRKQVAEFKNEIKDFGNQHFDFVENLEQMKSEVKQFGEEFVSFKHYIEMKERSSILSMNRSLQQLETKLLDTIYSAIESDSKTFGDKINTELKQMQEELYTTGRKTNQLDSEVNELKNKIYSLNKQLCAFNGHIYVDSWCYIHFESKKDWYDAAAHCENLGGNLAEIKSYWENQFLTEAYKDKSETWLGGSDRWAEGAWRWRSNDDYIYYTNWKKGEPNNKKGKEDCLEFNPKKRSGQWNDEDCSRHYSFLCEFYID